MSLKAFKILSNIRTLRGLAREMSVDKLESLVDKLNLVINERKEEILAQESETKERLERIEHYKEMLKKEFKGKDISDPEIAALLGKKTKGPRRKIKPRPAKYKFVDENGVEKTWTGQGRTPKELVGKDLSKYLIQLEITDEQENEEIAD